MRGHISLVVCAEKVAYFLAGDTTYDEQLLHAGIVDGASYSVANSLEKLSKIHEFACVEPIVLLPAHDPPAVERLSPT